MKSLIRCVSCYITLAVAIQLLSGSVWAESWLPIAWTEELAIGVPGQPNAQHFILEAPTLNDDGQVAFHSLLRAGSVNDGNLDTLWVGPANQPQLLARQGHSAAGTSEHYVLFGLQPQLNNNGQVLFEAQLSGDIDQSDGLWVGTPDNIQLLARAGTSLAGLPHMIETIDPYSLALSDSGKAAFTGSTTNGETAMWYGLPGALSTVVVEGQSVPASSGLPASVKFETILGPSDSPVLNSSGTLAFQASISSDTAPIFGRSLWVGTPGNLQLVAREETIPQGAGMEVSLFNTYPVINNQGQVAFGASLANFNDSLWIGTPGNLQKILEGNDPAPVGTAGVRFADFGTYSELRLSDSGHVGFEGWLDGIGVNSTNNYGLFRASTGGTDMVARLGNLAPGMQAGAVFQFFENFSINAGGSMAFMGVANGGGITGQDGRGIWAQNSAGELELVVRVGDWVHPVTGDVVRLADATNPSALQSQGYDEVFQIEFQSAFELNAEFGTAWNAQHQLAFLVRFADPANGTALFLADLGGVAGDFDNDGDVDGRDFLVWQRTDRTSAGLAAWQQEYGESGSLNAVAAVPEPTAITLAILCMTSAGFRRYLVR